MLGYNRLCLALIDTSELMIWENSTLSQPNVYILSIHEQVYCLKNICDLPKTAVTGTRIKIVLLQWDMNYTIASPVIIIACGEKNEKRKILNAWAHSGDAGSLRSHLAPVKTDRITESAWVLSGIEPKRKLKKSLNFFQNTARKIKCQRFRINAPTVVFTQADIGSAISHLVNLRRHIFT